MIINNPSNYDNKLSKCDNCKGSNSNITDSNNLVSVHLSFTPYIFLSSNNFFLLLNRSDILI